MLRLKPWVGVTVVVFLGVWTALAVVATGPGQAKALWALGVLTSPASTLDPWLWRLGQSVMGLGAGSRLVFDLGALLVLGVVQYAVLGLLLGLSAFRLRMIWRLGRQRREQS